VTRAASTRRTRIVRTAGTIASHSHSKTERFEQEPVCTGCAVVTERFALKTKYFYDEQNLKAFREEYAAMPLHEKAMENKLLAGGVWSRRFWRLLSCPWVAASSKSVLDSLVLRRGGESIRTQTRSTCSPASNCISVALENLLCGRVDQSRFIDGVFWSSGKCSHIRENSISKYFDVVDPIVNSAPRTVYSTSNSVATSVIRVGEFVWEPRQ